MISTKQLKMISTKQIVGGCVTLLQTQTHQTLDAEKQMQNALSLKQQQKTKASSKTKRNRFRRKQSRTQSQSAVEQEVQRLRQEKRKLINKKTQDQKAKSKKSRRTKHSDNGTKRTRKSKSLSPSPTPTAQKYTPSEFKSLDKSQSPPLCKPKAKRRASKELVDAIDTVLSGKVAPYKVERSQLDSVIQFLNDQYSKGGAGIRSATELKNDYEQYNPEGKMLIETAQDSGDEKMPDVEIQSNFKNGEQVEAELCYEIAYDEYITKYIKVTIVDIDETEAVEVLVNPVDQDTRAYRQISSNEERPMVSKNDIRQISRPLMAMSKWQNPTKLSKSSKVQPKQKIADDEWGNILKTLYSHPQNTRVNFATPEPFGSGSYNSFYRSKSDENKVYKVAYSSERFTGKGPGTMDVAAENKRLETEYKLTSDLTDAVRGVDGIQNAMGVPSWTIQKMDDPKLGLCVVPVTCQDAYYCNLDELTDKNWEVCGKQMTQDEIASVFDTLDRQLIEFHKQGYIHSDIKPENMLIRRQGFEPTGAIEVVLADLDPYLINEKTNLVDVPNGALRMTTKWQNWKFQIVRQEQEVEFLCFQKEPEGQQFISKSQIPADEQKQNDQYMLAHSLNAVFFPRRPKMDKLIWQKNSKTAQLKAKLASQFEKLRSIYEQEKQQYDDRKFFTNVDQSMYYDNDMSWP